MCFIFIDSLPDAFSIQKAESILKEYNKAVQKMEEDSKVQGGSFSMNPNRNRNWKVIKLDKIRKVPEKCKGKDSCYDFRLCKLCMPYWKEAKEAITDDNQDEEENVGIDAADAGYEEAYEDQDDSGYDW